VRCDGSEGRRVGWVKWSCVTPSLFAIDPRKVFIYDRPSKSFWIKLFFPPVIVIGPYPLMFFWIFFYKQKNTADAAKSVLRTVHSYPSPEVFLRSTRKWGGSFAEVFFIKCPHHTWFWGENGSKPEPSVQTFMFREHPSPSCDSEGVKIQFHWHKVRVKQATQYKRTHSTRQTTGTQPALLAADDPFPSSLEAIPAEEWGRTWTDCRTMTLRRIGQCK